MKPPLDGTPDQPTLPILRVLSYLERQEYSLEWGLVEYANRWYTPAMHLMREIYRREVWKDLA